MHAFRMACLQMALPVLIDVVMYVVYYVTVRVVGFWVCRENCLL
jgi:hypothetical protein